MSGKYDFKLITETESKEDLYKSQTHERMAGTILDVIERSDNGLCIGLEGNYGIGKSTVIRLLRDKYLPENHTICYFDAWTHENDPLRQVFLECFINESQVKDKDLDDLKKKITSTESTVTKTINKSVSWFGIFLTVATFLVPLGLALSRKIDLYYVFYNFSFAGNLYETFILFLLLGPFIVILYKFLNLVLTNKSVTDSDNWSYLNKNHKETITEITFDDNNTTSIEFEKKFWNIVKIIKKSNNNAKIVLILDNLDRTTNLDGIRLFTNLQSLIKNKRSVDQENANNFNKIFVVVPYDNLVFDSKIIGTDYIDKTMDLRFNLSKPSTSDWQAIAETLIRKTFSNWPQEESDVNDVLRIYTRAITSPSHSFTPRQLNLFINHVGILRIHFSEYISTEMISYYVVFKYLRHKSHDEFIDDLLKETMPIRRDIPFLNSTNPRGELAAIIYDTDIKTAYILLLERELSIGLADGPEKLLELKNNHSINFNMVFYDRIKNTDKPQLVENASNIITAFKDNPDIDLKPFKNLLSEIFNNRYGNLYSNFTKEFETNLSDSINFSGVDSIDTFWQSFVEQEILFRLSNDETSDDPYEKIWFLYRVFKKLRANIISIKVRFDSKNINMQSLCYQAYEKKINLEELFEFDLNQLEEQLKSKVKLKSYKDTLEPKAFYVMRLINKCTENTIYRTDKIYSNYEGQFFNKENLIDLMMLLSNELGAQKEPLLPIDFVNAIFSDLPSDTKYLQVQEFAIVSFIAMPDLYLNSKDNAKKKWIIDFWKNIWDGVDIDLVIHFINSHSLIESFVNLFKYKKLPLQYSVLENLIDNQKVRVEDFTDEQNQWIIRGLKNPSKFRDKFSAALALKNFSR